MGLECPTRLSAILIAEKLRQARLYHSVLPPRLDREAQYDCDFLHCRPRADMPLLRRVGFGPERHARSEDPRKSAGSVDHRSPPRPTEAHAQEDVPAAPVNWSRKSCHGYGHPGSCPNGRDCLRGNRRSSNSQTVMPKRHFSNQAKPRVEGPSSSFRRCCPSKAPPKPVAR